MTTKANRQVQRRPDRRRAYILIAVLGLTAVVATLGWAFLDAHSTIMPEAANRSGSVRAQYLAESGVHLGMHYLMYPPTTVDAGDFWPGASGIAIDATPDYTDITITQDSDDPNLFKIVAVGVALAGDGSVQGKHAIWAEVIVPPDGKWHIPYALASSNDSIHPPWTASMFGDVHANGQIVSEGWCQGDVTATDRIWWAGGGPPASITEYAAAYTAPSANPAIYETYSIDDVDYSVFKWPYSELQEHQADWANAQNWSASNPGRIIYRGGYLDLYDDVHLTGTLVVNGNLYIFGRGVEITAVPGYPALIVKGDILFWNHGDSLAVTGSVLCGGTISDLGNSVSMDVTGACIVGRYPGIDFNWDDDSFNAYWDANRSVFWNFEQKTDRGPITILSWKEK